MGLKDHDVTHGRTYRYATKDTGLVVPFGAGMAGDEVQHPLKSLFDFVRVDNVGAGASTDVTFTVNRDSLLLVSQAGDRVSTPGTFTLSFENGAGQAVTAELQAAGKGCQGTANNRDGRKTNILVQIAIQQNLVEPM
eukprot:gene10097-29207_t